MEHGPYTLKREEPEYRRLGVVEFKRGFPVAVCEYGADDGQQFGSIALDGWLQQSFGVFTYPGTDTFTGIGIGEIDAVDFRCKRMSHVIDE